MSLSRMENTTFTMPSIIDSDDMGLRTVLQSRCPKRNAYSTTGETRRYRTEPGKEKTGGADEAQFWLNGYVNKQNCRIWSEANTQVYVETPLHPEKLTVWCALWAGGILLQKR
ncbi:hypothetical protein TNCV_3003801 [Trichonephila clavipes]|nr:hypothetical protein TNCV_3003801 [Trichonephila clavipes]